MTYVIIKIDGEGPRVISLGSKSAMKAQMFDIMWESETGFQRFENDFGYGIRVTEAERGEQKVIKYILHALDEEPVL